MFNLTKTMLMGVIISTMLIPMTSFASNVEVQKVEDKPGIERQFKIGTKGMMKDRVFKDMQGFQQKIRASKERIQEVKEHRGFYQENKDKLRKSVVIMREHVNENKQFYDEEILPRMQKLKEVLLVVKSGIKEDTLDLSQEDKSKIRDIMSTLRDEIRKINVGKREKRSQLKNTNIDVSTTVSEIQEDIKEKLLELSKKIDETINELKNIIINNQ